MKMTKDISGQNSLGGLLIYLLGQISDSNVAFQFLNIKCIMILGVFFFKPMERRDWEIYLV